MGQCHVPAPSRIKQAGILGADALLVPLPVNRLVPYEDGEDDTATDPVSETQQVPAQSHERQESAIRNLGHDQPFQMPAIDESDPHESVSDPTKGSQQASSYIEEECDDMSSMM